jgi:hypothetical protein
MNVQKTPPQNAATIRRAPNPTPTSGNRGQDSTPQADISGVTGVGEFVRDLTLILLLKPDEV